jgi:hypothetical protein
MIITKEMDTNILSGIVKFSNITKPIDTKAFPFLNKKNKLNRNDKIISF